MSGVVKAKFRRILAEAMQSARPRGAPDELRLEEVAKIWLDLSARYYYEHSLPM